MPDNYDAAEYFDPMNVNDGVPARKVSEDGEHKDRDQLVLEIDYERVKKDIENLYIPEHVVNGMLDDFEFVTVRDFNDIYHKSEEERIEENKFYHLFATLNNMTHRANSVDAFIIRTRLTIDILREIAENNGILSPTKFIKDYFDEKIIINGLPIPKLRSKFRKKFNIGYLVDFIMGDEDPALFAPKRKEYGDEEREIDSLLPPEVISDIENATTDPVSTNGYFDETDDPDGRNVAIIYSKKTAKDMGKDIPALLDAAMTIGKLEKRRERMYGSLNNDRFIGDVRADDFEKIEAYDQTIYDNPDGIKEPSLPKDMTNQDEVNAYLLAMDVYYEQTTYVDSPSGTKTIEDRDADEIKNALASNGFEIRSMYGFKEQKKKLKAMKKEEARKEKKLKNKLVRLQNRRGARLGNDKRRLSDKKSKKKKNKSKKKSKNFIEDATGTLINKSKEKEAFNFEWDM